MTQTGATQQATDTAIRPFHINFPEEELIELRRRINATRFPDRLREVGQSGRIQN